ncbi:DUF6368 family protein [Massilia glaciei]|uniref:Uncharacterized protein n=1 Tax=Massilia glaciei TaxID=1524097 RepID=A0A2U2HI71_9BURK|nr:DUF6368 family protein [Massilia glaciei]PWF46031.1 hypothetical protein C7C56_016680 [Massilia glaciei]
MAGATAEVLLRQSISDGERELIENYIRTAASSVEGKSFWIAGRPFVWYDGPADEEELALDILGLNPCGVVGFCAMSRGPVSEAYLAMLVAHIAQKLDGVVALGGHIKSFADDGILVMEGRFEGAYGDYVTPEFLYHWIGHPKFRMIN